MPVRLAVQPSERWCSTCLDETTFESVEFEDGLGGEGEQCCTLCGLAIVVGLAPPALLVDETDAVAA